MPTMFYLYVPKMRCAVQARPRQLGRRRSPSPQDQPYGDRSGGVTDPFGNKWYIATHIKDM